MESFLLRAANAQTLNAGLGAQAVLRRERAKGCHCEALATRHPRYERQRIYVRLRWTGGQVATSPLPAPRDNNRGVHGKAPVSARNYTRTLSRIGARDKVLRHSCGARHTHPESSGVRRHWMPDPVRHDDQGSWKEALATKQPRCERNHVYVRQEVDGRHVPLASSSR